MSFYRFPFINRLFERYYLAGIGTPPKHVAVIMDGNGRWAKRRGLSRLHGHRAGTKATKLVVKAAVRAGVEHLTVYIFSTENWKRPVTEVKNLMDLFVEVLERELDELNRSGVRIRVIGDMPGLPQRTRDSFKNAEEFTRNNKGLNLYLALNYGGRQEIVEAVNKLTGPATMEAISANLYASEMPDPELVIRTGGDMRISNFLLWQSAYSEYYFTRTLWPDFSQAEFFYALKQFARRERRFGGVVGDDLPKQEKAPAESEVSTGHTNRADAQVKAGKI